MEKFVILFEKGFLSVPKSEFLHIWKEYRIFMLTSNFDKSFSMNYFHRVLRVLCGEISSIFYTFQDKLNRD